MRTVEEMTVGGFGAIRIERRRGCDDEPHYLIVEDGGRVYGYGCTVEGALESARFSLERLSRDVAVLIGGAR